MVLDLGDRSVELAHFGRGHTATDSCLFVPDAGVGVRRATYSRSRAARYGDDSYPLEWPAKPFAVLVISTRRRTCRATANIMPPAVRQRAGRPPSRKSAA